MRREGTFGCCGCFSGCVLMVLGIVACLSLASIALYWQLTQNPPAPPLGKFTPNQAQANNVDTKIDNAKRTASTQGNFELSITQEEASSWLNLNADIDQNSQNNNNEVLENFQVAFRNGSAFFYVEYVVSDTSLVLTTEMFFSIDPTTQKLLVRVDKTKIGNIELPQGWQDEMATSTQTELQQELERISSTYRITRLSLNEGRLIITGQAR